MSNDVLPTTNETSAAVSGTEARRDFRYLLQSVLIERCRNNPRYSMRALARSLKLEASFLSKLIAGKRKVTPRLIQKIAPILGLSPRETQAYLPTRDGPNHDPFFVDLCADAFEAIADWHHYAILELVQTEGFREDPRWIAGRLGASPVIVQAALERLLRLKLIERDPGGAILRGVENYTNATAGFTTGALRKLQRQILRQAIVALDEVPIELRDQTSMTMGIDPDRMPEIRDRIDGFRRGLCAWLQAEGKPRKEVYQLSISLFPVTQPKS